MLPFVCSQSENHRLAKKITKFCLVADVQKLKLDSLCGLFSVPIFVLSSTEFVISSAGVFLFNTYFLPIYILYQKNYGAFGYANTTCEMVTRYAVVLAMSKCL